MNFEQILGIGITLIALVVLACVYELVKHDAKERAEWEKYTRNLK